MKNFAKGRVGLRRVSGQVVAGLVCWAFFAGGFGLPRSFATLVGVGGAGLVDWVSGVLPVPRARLGLPASLLTICRR